MRFLAAFEIKEHTYESIAILPLLKDVTGALDVCVRNPLTQQYVNIFTSEYKELIKLGYIDYLKQTMVFNNYYIAHPTLNKYVSLESIDCNFLMEIKKIKIDFENEKHYLARINYYQNAETFVFTFLPM